VYLEFPHGNVAVPSGKIKKKSPEKPRILSILEEFTPVIIAIL